VIRAVVVVTLALCIALSVPLWGTVREFPPAPLLVSLPLPDVSPLWVVLLLLALLAVALVPRRWTPLPFIIVAASLVLVDQTRLQPWLYQGALFLGSFAWSDRPRPAVQLVVSATYVWSGVSKLNPDFGQGVIPWAAAAAGTRASLPAEWLAPLGMAVGVLEAAIGVALLLPALRRAAALAAALMHGLLLLALGPLGHGWNPVVWPWNLGMAALVVLVFWDEASAPRRILWSSDWYHRALVVLVGILPALHPAGLWDAYLSFSLYSLNVDEAWLAAERGAAASLGPEARAVAETGTDGRLIVRFLPWAMRDVKTPPYPERRAYLAAFRVLCERAERPAELRLIVVRSRAPFAAARPGPEPFTCRDVR
jgi:uncharacterized membrane protein YphA (DoxX/SURF4 family)